MKGGVKVTRVTREESRARTRTRLLEAAAEVFVERGFHGASVEEIAERAGFTRGAVYSNFRDKADLLLALLDQRTAEQVADVTAVVNQASSPAELFEALKARDMRHEPSPDWLMLRTEFWLYAMRHPEVRPALAERARALQEQYAGAIAAQFTAVGLEVPARVDDLALIVQLIDEGLPARRWIDPSLDEDTFFDLVGLLYEAGVALAGDKAKTKAKAKAKTTRRVRSR